MSKVTKNERISTLEEQLSVMQTQISSLIECAHSHTERLIALEPDNPFHGKFYKPERDIAKELLEVDLSSDLMGSELCRAMLERGDKCVLIRMGVRDDKQAKDIGRFAIAISIDESGRFNVMSDQQPITKVSFAVPINNQGEPLTAAEVGL